MFEKDLELFDIDPLWTKELLSFLHLILFRELSQDTTSHWIIRTQALCNIAIFVCQIINFSQHYSIAISAIGHFTLADKQKENLFYIYIYISMYVCIFKNKTCTLIRKTCTKHFLLQLHYYNMFAYEQYTTYLRHYVGWCHSKMCYGNCITYMGNLIFKALDRP